MTKQEHCDHRDDLEHDHPLQTDDVVASAAAMCAAMGDVRRLRLLELMLHGRHCVSQLAEETGASMPSISQRLKILHQARLVSRQREGKHIYYALADGHVRDILKQLFIHSSE